MDQLLGVAGDVAANSLRAVRERPKRHAQAGSPLTPERPFLAEYVGRSVQEVCSLFATVAPPNTARC